jgi:inorganic phosphate transporter, PiT family
MSTVLLLVIIIVVVALIFDFINGFHDAANSIATIVATRVLSPGTAVVWAAFFNFIAAFGFGTAVAKTIGSGMIRLDDVTQTVILAGLLGAIVWQMITWVYGLPISCSHALIGGFGGAAVARAGFESLIVSGWAKTLVFIVVAPISGLILGMAIMVGVSMLCRSKAPRNVDVWFRRLQLFSAAVYSFAHGTNDAQKVMGIIAGALFTAGYLGDTFYIPFWVVLAAHAAIAMGTLFGGWRIVRTMGHKLTKLRPVGGFSAETAGAITVLFAAHYGIPVSTTHTIAGAIVGVGTTQRLSAVRWAATTRIVWAWVLTIPASALAAALILAFFRYLNPNA